jgi:NADH-quinone oxidoreductase subunit H
MQIFLDLADFLRAWILGMGISATATELILTAVWALVAILFILINLIILVWLERKFGAFFQQRRGPNRIGPAGFLQFPVDIVKVLGKEDIIPAAVDRPVFKIASICSFVTTITAFAVIPFAKGMVLEDLSIGIFYFIAIGSTATMSLLMGGISSNNKYAFIGGMRAVAQMISYEIPMVFSLLGVVMIAGSLRLTDIVEAQKNVWFVVPQLVAFIVYFIATIAETNRGPFDLAEGEQELVAGYFLEYSGIRWAIFFIAEYGNLVAVSAIATIMFLGGWNAPFGLTFIPGFFWFMIKVYFMVFLFMWVKWTFPRIRIDHLMHFGWKFLIPVSMANIVVTGIGVYVYRMITG